MGLRRDKTPSRFAQLDKKAGKVDDEKVAMPASTQSNIQLIPQANGVIKTMIAGQPALHLVFPVSHGDAEILDASYLLRTPNLTEGISTAFLKRYATQSRKTRIFSNKWLRLGFFEFLKFKNKEDLSLSELDSSLVHEFIHWLDRVDPGTGEPVWKVTTRNSYYTIAGRMIEALKLIPKWRKQIPLDFSMPTHQWPGKNRQHNPIPIIKDEDFARLYHACLAEMTQVRLDIDKDMALLRESIHEIPKNPTTYSDYKSRGVVLATMDEILQDRIPCYAQMYETHKYLPTAIKAKFGTVLKLRSVLAPNPRDLVPFILMLAIHTRLNAEALLGSNLNDYYVEDRLGEKRFQARVNKGRSRRKQMPSSPIDEAFDNPHSIVEFLKDWTARIRKLAKPEIANRLFLFVTRTGVTHVAKFNTEGNDSRTTWTDSLRLFCRDHNLKLFTLQQLRPTTLDIGRAIHNNDILASQALGEHRSPEITHSHYTSDAQRERNAERLGEITTLRTRWLETEGKAESRNVPENVDEGAVTPGWRCLDPYESPYSPHGKLCSAYGRCPACKFAQLDIHSEYSAAQALNLLDALRRARVTMDPQGWLVRMGPVENKLSKFWLPQFSPEVLEKAKALNLPPLPTPD